MDVRMKKGEVVWTVHFYVGKTERPCKGRSRMGYFRTSGLAKAAAVRRYRRLLRIWNGELRNH